MKYLLATALADALSSLDTQKHFIAVTNNLVLENAAVLSAVVTKDACTLRLCYPLHEAEPIRLADSKYTPLMRSKAPMTVGLDECNGISYAYCSVKLPPYGSALDYFDAMHRLSGELGAYIAHTATGKP
jgi:hypothetical protein